MSRLGRVRSEATAGWRSFVRRRTAVFFTFFFPVILIVIFGALVRTDPTGEGLFAESPAYYVPGYLATVVLFTPLSRMGSEVARHREGNRFEKLATTPLSRAEWLVSQTIVNAVIIALAGLLILVMVVALTGAQIVYSPWLVPYVLVGVICFCGIGTMLGSYTDSRDGAIAASNAIAFPLLFLSETFVTLEQLPDWFEPLVNLSPLTYFARGVRAATYPEAGTPAVAGVDPVLANIVILAAVAVVTFALGARSIPRTD
ncbi:ABC transporter permease [Natrarchaeobaculum sulfurireducens]|uniref:ABC-type multidrug transport system, permease component n=1 Tax=Natrarchaeobaculum sulfurireducens TaxID=2044521 RepID=A0A346PNH4_9EURY|nr:ABC transporter permease [Natrarchaeobaculum sulfurireducens]AXR78885.1 ABC-type multidrug transport system, permease component [Natrarchaeobaculum sulfurireducens]AXR81069.1 ABC-type transport system permease protein [Natrarchaeobaculum sulfurireducens]